MSEVCAAMGLTNLEGLDARIERNRLNYLAYGRELGAIAGVRLCTMEREGSNYQYVVVTVEDDAPLTRDELVEVLHAENVVARRYFFPGVHRMEPYRSYFPHAHLLLPVTETLCRKVMVLPTGPSVTEEDVARVCRLIGTALAQAPAVRRCLKQRVAANPAG
jgi:dTDP-4-amino-4,6-dideoxygalactose transaminase